MISNGWFIRENLIKMDDSCMGVVYQVVATQIFLEFSPWKLGKMHPFWRAYFSKGVGLKPPTSQVPKLPHCENYIFFSRIMVQRNMAPFGDVSLILQEPVFSQNRASVVAWYDVQQVLDLPCFWSKVPFFGWLVLTERTPKTVLGTNLLCSTAHQWCPVGVFSWGGCLPCK